MTEPVDAESITATVDSSDDEPSVESKRPPDDESAVESETPRADDHLADVEAGAGCTEIWEHLSEQRESDDD